MWANKKLKSVNKNDNKMSKIADNSKNKESNPPDKF